MFKRTYGVRVETVVAATAGGVETVLSAADGGDIASEFRSTSCAITTEGINGYYVCLCVRLYVRMSLGLSVSRSICVCVPVIIYVCQSLSTSLHVCLLVLCMLYFNT